MTRVFLYVISLLAIVWNCIITLKMVKKVTTNFDSSKASVSDCMPMVVLKNYEPELSYILAELFNMCLKESCFQIFGRSHWWSQYLRILGKDLLLKTTILLLFFLWLVKSLKTHLEKCGLFSDCQYGFRSSRSTADLRTAVSDRISRAFNRSDRYCVLVILKVQLLVCQPLCVCITEFHSITDPKLFKPCKIRH